MIINLFNPEILKKVRRIFEKNGENHPAFERKVWKESLVIKDFFS